MELVGKVVGVAASGGVAVGPVFVYSPSHPDPERKTIASGTEEAGIWVGVCGEAARSGPGAYPEASRARG